MNAFQVISLTDAAKTRLGEIIAANVGADGIKIGIKKGGCAGMEYTVDLVKDLPREVVRQVGGALVADRRPLLEREQRSEQPLRAALEGVLLVPRPLRPRPGQQQLLRFLRGQCHPATAAAVS